MIAIGYCVFEYIGRQKIRIQYRFGTLKEALDKADRENMSHDYKSFGVAIVGIDGKYYRPSDRQKCEAQSGKEFANYLYGSSLQSAWQQWLRQGM